MDATNHTSANKGTQLLTPNKPSREAVTYPLVICFHGSGDSCESWQELAQILVATYRVLLFNRGPSNPNAKLATADMIQYLADAKLSPPYVLIGHSYGGNFAREFLQQRSGDVVGMVLAETGQETALDPAMEERQYKRPILGTKPLSVIRANSMIGKTKQLEEKIRDVQGDEDRENELRNSPEFAMVDAWDKEDERLKKRQLGLSKNSRYLHIPDCGHHVIRDRPDAVADEVRWVIENCNQAPEKRSYGVMRLLGKILR